MLDPESYDWDLLDSTMLNRLDTQKYVSLARNRRLKGTTHGADENGGAGEDYLSWKESLVDTR